MKAGFLVVGIVAASVAFPVLGQKKYDPGASDSEIKIGNTNPYSGPASAYGTIGKTIAAYFKMVNEQGGINGRKVNFITYDDGYSPPKTVEMARKLVEQDQVLFLFQTLGTPPNTAIHKYMNMRKVPQLHVATGATKWNEPKDFPWTMGWQPNYQDEAKIYAQHLMKQRPNAKIGILYQNDDYGKDYLKGIKDGLGAKAKSMIVAEVSYEVADPTVDSQIVQLQASGADVFFNITTPKFAAQAIRKAYDIGWKPLHFLNNGSLVDNSNMYGYTVATTLHQVLRQCGDNLTRENVMRQAASMKGFAIDTLLPGVAISTSSQDFAPIQSVQLMRFNGSLWERFGEILSSGK
jgi:branched-chain amino acid transport system substrate-binding protein